MNNQVFVVDKTPNQVCEDCIHNAVCVLKQKYVDFYEKMLKVQEPYMDFLDGRYANCKHQISKHIRRDIDFN